MPRVAHKKTKPVPSYSKDHYFGQSKNHLRLYRMRWKHTTLAGAVPRMPGLEHLRGEPFRIDFDQCPLSGFGASRAASKVICHQGRRHAKAANARGRV